MNGRHVTAAAAATVTAAAVVVWLWPTSSPNSPDANSPDITGDADVADSSQPDGSSSDGDSDATPPDGRAAPPLTSFRVGNTVTYDGALIGAGNAGRDGDTVRIDVWCGTGRCEPADTRIDIGGVVHTGTNPLEIGATQPGLHHVQVQVAGRPDPARSYTLVAGERTVDWPVDAWGAGSWPDPQMVATVWADTAGLVPRCATFPSGDPRRCPTPSPVTVLPGGQSALLPPLSGPDGPLDPTDCAARWRHQYRPDRWDATEGVPPGCVDRALADQVLAAVWGDGLDSDIDSSPADMGVLPGHDSDDGWLTVGKLSAHVAAAAGPDLARPSPVAITPAAGVVGQTVTVTATVHGGLTSPTTQPDTDSEPSGGGDVDDTAAAGPAVAPPSPTRIMWPEPDGTVRLCDADAPLDGGAATCNYQLTAVGTVTATAEIDTADGAAAPDATLPVITDPSAPELAITSRRPQPADATTVWTLEVARPVDTVTLDPAVNGADIALTPSRRTITVTLPASADTTVIGCTSSGCGRAHIATHTAELDSDVDLPVRTVVHLARHTTVLHLPDGNWDPQLDHPAVQLGHDPSGRVTATVDPHLPDGTGPVHVDLDGDDGRRLELCLQLPDGPSCPGTQPADHAGWLPQEEVGPWTTTRSSAWRPTQPWTRSEPRGGS